MMVIDDHEELAQMLKPMCTDADMSFHPKLRPAICSSARADTGALFGIEFEIAGASYRKMS
jgi:hypothetical protein